MARERRPSGSDPQLPGDAVLRHSGRQTSDDLAVAGVADGHDRIPVDLRRDPIDDRPSPSAIAEGRVDVQSRDGDLLEAGGAGAACGPIAEGSRPAGMAGSIQDEGSQTESVAFRRWNSGALGLTQGWFWHKL